jgi:glycosyltransferase involved in cell wall biosynthesis
MRLIFSKGALFYAEFNFRLFLTLLFKKADILLANDLDTLLANHLACSFKRNVTLVYDSHEYFTEVPELQGRFARKVWLAIERWIFPRLKHVYTVNQSIADIYQGLYGVQVGVVRNVPDVRRVGRRKSRQELGLPEKNILILQGAGINVDRGAEEAVQSMAELSDDFLLLIIGAGDVMSELKKMVDLMDLSHKVNFIQRLPYEELMQFTMNSNLGLSLDKKGSANYDLALPNKIFDSIAAGIPVLIGPTTEAKRLVEEHKVGAVLSEVTPMSIAAEVKRLFDNSDEMARYSKNTESAAQLLNWKMEEQELFRIFAAID